MLELFCGTAGLTAAFKRLGFSSAVAVDKTNPKFSHASVIVLDLTKSEHQSLVLDWIRHDRTIAVFHGTRYRVAHAVLRDQSR